MIKEDIFPHRKFCKLYLEEMFLQDKNMPPSSFTLSIAHLHKYDLKRTSEKVMYYIKSVVKLLFTPILTVATTSIEILAL